MTETHAHLEEWKQTTPRFSPWSSVGLTPLICSIFSWAPWFPSNQRISFVRNMSPAYVHTLDQTQTPFAGASMLESELAHKYNGLNLVNGKPHLTFVIDYLRNVRASRNDARSMLHVQRETFWNSQAAKVNQKSRNTTAWTGSQICGDLVILHSLYR